MLSICRYILMSIQNFGIIDLLTRNIASPKKVVRSFEQVSILQILGVLPPHGVGRARSIVISAGSLP